MHVVYGLRRRLAIDAPPTIAGEYGAPRQTHVRSIGNSHILGEPNHQRHRDGVTGAVEHTIAVGDTGRLSGKDKDRGSSH
jgi:hypothetical protein